jgi:AraC family transcriptional regulator
MKQVFPCGTFYGINRCQVETSAFVFNEVEDFVNNRVPLHTHENAHFLFVVSGEYEAVVKDKKISCKSPTVLYYPAGTTHDDHFYTRGGKFLTVSFTSVANEKLFEQISFIDYSVDFDNIEISSLGKRIRKELRFPDSLSSIVLEGMATELLAYASRNLNKSDKVPDWLKLAYELINDCCSESIKINKIAATVGVHPLYLASTFRKFFNCSPGEYLRKCRIELASNFLLEQKKSLVEIALMSGFADQSQFTRSFKQHTGLTPAKFRKLYKS